MSNGSKCLLAYLKPLMLFELGRWNSRKKHDASRCSYQNKENIPSATTDATMRKLVANVAKCTEYDEQTRTIRDERIEEICIISNNEMV